MTKKYIYGPGIDNPIVMINVSGTTETWYYYYTDALGSVRLITDHTGDIVESYTYNPFGWPRVMTSGDEGDGNWLTEDTTTRSYSPLGNPYMFTARRWDYNANLYYYRFRDYQPDLGRFCQPDPLGYIDGMNLYAYCINSPLNWIDPWGLIHGGAYGPGSFGDICLGEDHNIWEILPTFGVGFDTHISAVLSPFGTAGGPIYGLNGMLFTDGRAGLYFYSHLNHSYYPNWGLDFGVGIQGVFAWGGGPWAGNFRSYVGAVKFFTASYFNSPQGDWNGITGGASYGIPFALAIEETIFEILVGIGEETKSEDE